MLDSGGVLTDAHVLTDSGSVTVNSGGTLEVGSGGVLTDAHALTDSGTVTVDSGGVVTVNSGGSLGTFNFASPQQANTPTYLGVLDSLQEITKIVISADAY